MTKRLIEFYKRVSAGQEETMSFIWKAVASTVEQGLIQALLSEDEKRVEEMLERRSPEDWQYNMESLAQWQPHDYENPYVRRCIDAGLNMTLPDFLGFKNATGVPMGFVAHGVISLLIKQHNGQKYPESILEIGPGLGFMAVHMFRAGVRDYTMIDLPINAVVAAHVISKCVGEDQVWLFGEPESSRPIRLFASTNYGPAAERQYQVIFNKNSFPEIPPAEQDKYVTLFGSCLSEAGLLFSINHEDRPPPQRPLPEAMRGQKALRCVHHEPFSAGLAQNEMRRYEESHFLEIYRR